MNFGAATVRERSAPNIVLIVSDDQGYADLGCCGRPELKTKLTTQAAKRLDAQAYIALTACTSPLM